MSPFWVPLAAAASFSSSPCLFMCVSIPPQVTPCCKLPRIVSRAPERDGQRLGRGLSSRQHVSAHTQAVFHHRVAGGQRQPLARVSLRGSYPAGGAQLCQFQPDEPFSQRLPLHWQGGLLQPGLGLCRGRLAPSEPGRAGPSRAPSSRLGRPPAACFALHAPALRLAAKGPLHLLPVANTPLPVSGPQVPRYVQLFSSLLSSPASSGGPRPVPAVRMLGVGGRPLPGAEGSARLGSAGPGVFCPCLPLRQTWKSCQSRAAWAWFCFAAFPGLFWFPGKRGANGKARPAGTSSAFCPHSKQTKRWIFFVPVC